MALETRLQMKQTQKLVMTAMLQQAIKLLPLCNMELKEHIEQELLENPLLEEVPAVEKEAERREQEGHGEKEAREAEGINADGTEINVPIDVGMDWEVYFQANEDYGFTYQEYEEAPSYDNVIKSDTTLEGHLLWQLHMACKDDRQKEIGAYLIGNIDGNGYLTCELPEAAQELGAAPGEVEEVLRIIHTFDPAGVGCRSLQECLLIQVRNNPSMGGLAEKIIGHHMENLKNERFKKMARELKVPMDEVIGAVKFIRSLDPFPGRTFSSFNPEYITPDVTVIKVNDDYQVILNEEEIPRIRINPHYQSIIRRELNGNTSVRQFLEERARSAMWLIKSIEQRRQTLYKVATSIVRFQRDFLDRGIPCLRPLILRDVADDIGMHESTVSRVTTNKYMDTPQGIFEMKYFFHSRLNSDMGDVMSSVSVKELIRQKVVRENGSRPYTDLEIMEYLEKKGISIARRTVAKYRKELKIPSSSRRKKKDII